jgi:hypothetical protein
MAKDKSKSNKSEKVDAKNEKAAEREFKYGVEDIAEELGIKPASVRVQLRNKGIEKAGKAYGWNSKSELKEVIEQIKAKADEDEDEAPAKKSKKKDKAEKPVKTDKKAKKAKTKKSKDDEDEDDD